MSKAVIEEEQELGVITDSEDKVVSEDATGAEEILEDEQITDEEAHSEPEESQEDDDGVVVTLGEESLTPEEETGAPEWVRELRKNYRDSQRTIKELERQLNTKEAPMPQEIASPGKKPTLADFDYNDDEYEKALADWFTKKNQADEQKRIKELENQKLEAEYQDKLNQYEDAKTKLKLSDFDEAEESVLHTLDTTQQSIILSGSDNPALTVYAIGKSKKRAQELASIKDPVKFAFAVSKLESQLTVTRKKAKPLPEKVVTGSSRNTNGVDTTLERLRVEADKTGDRSKVVAYMRKLKANQQ
jgi:hypothetical protein